MGAVEDYYDYIENPTAAGARQLGRWAAYGVPDSVVVCPPPVELAAHASAFQEGFSLERLRRATVGDEQAAREMTATVGDEVNV